MESLTKQLRYMIVREVSDNGEFVLEQKNKFSVSEKIEVMKPDGRDIEVNVISIKDEEGNEMESCPHPKQKLLVKLSETPERGDVLRVKE